MDPPQPFLRKFILGNGFKLIRKFIIGLWGIADTQCGFKCFSGSVAEDIFTYQTMTGWSFDIELLYIARQRGYRIQEIPIHWYFNPDTKLNAFRDAIRMLSDIFQIHSNWRRGLYTPIS